MAARRTKAKDKLSAKLAADVAAFLADGGKIEPVDYTANQSFKAAGKGKQHIPMVVNPQNAQHNVRFPRDHNWRVSADGKKPDG